MPDTIRVLVGRTTYEEMAAYWPGALSDDVRHRDQPGDGAAYERLSQDRLLAVRQHRADALEQCGTGRGGHRCRSRGVSGGPEGPARPISICRAAPVSAQSVVALDLVDEFYFFTYPIVSPGESWFSTSDREARSEIARRSRIRARRGGIASCITHNCRSAAPREFYGDVAIGAISPRNAEPISPKKPWLAVLFALFHSGCHCTARTSPPQGARRRPRSGHRRPQGLHLPRPLPRRSMPWRCTEFTLSRRAPATPASMPPSASITSWQCSNNCSNDKRVLIAVMRPAAKIGRQCAAEEHVEFLQPAADAEDGLAMLDHMPGEREGDLIALLVHPIFRARARAVARRCDIRPRAGEQQPVQAIGQRGGVEHIDQRRNEQHRRARRYATGLDEAAGHGLDGTLGDFVAAQNADDRLARPGRPAGKEGRAHAAEPARLVARRISLFSGTCSSSLRTIRCLQPPA